MQINITIDDTDTAALDAFCKGTGWTADSGQDQPSWLYDQINQYIATTCRSGMVLAAMADANQAYAAAVDAAQSAVSQEMGRVTISVGSAVQPVPLPP